MASSMIFEIMKNHFVENVNQSFKQPSDWPFPWEAVPVAAVNFISIFVILMYCFHLLYRVKQRKLFDSSVNAWFTLSEVSVRDLEKPRVQLIR